MEIVFKGINEIKPYEKNPRRNDKAVEYVKNSIKEFGFKVPIVIDKDGIIVAGHTRYRASKELHLDKVPCIIADDLTPQQIKAFRIADNKVSEKAKWDYDLLDEEMYDIEIDMSQFGFDLNVDDINSYYGDERERTNKAYNLDLVESLTNDFWQMPVIRNDNYTPSDLIGFNYAKSSNNKKCGIHFYIDDYQFERIWNYPEKYIDILKEYECILTPDFSLYLDMPMPMKVWNIFRSRLVGQYYQSKGIKVIPTISWAEEETFKFCFLGIPKKSVVSISTIGVKESKEAMTIWKKGVDEMIKQIEPSCILIYGGKVDYDFKDIKVIYYDNKVLDNWKEREE